MGVVNKMFILMNSHPCLQCVFSGDVLGQNSPFLIVTCRQETNPANKTNTIHCILLHIEFTEGIYSDMKVVSRDNKTPNRVVTALDWVTLKQGKM